MKRRILTLVSVLLLICLLPWHALAGLYWGEVVLITAKSSANVRKGPGAEYGMIGEAKGENTYTYLGEKDGWYHIQFTAEKKGYISSKYGVLQPGIIWDDDVPGTVDAVVRNTHYNALNVRNKPSLDSRVLGEIRPDTTWPYRGTENGWHRILYDGSLAYVAANRSTVEVAEDTVSSATVKTAPAANACDKCLGSGECSVCEGAKEIYSSREKRNVPCPTCDGLGVCWACEGRGER